MPLHRSFQSLWLLPVVLAGCSTTMGSKFGGTPQSKSIAVVGDRPLPASTGEPGGRVVADAEEPEPRRNPKTRISGRVVDEAGDPVPGATVRLADGAVKGGKEIRGVTDRSGGFTLNGLRTGSTYILIAEAEDDKGPLIGRAEAKTADTGVEISLGSEDKKATTTRRTARPSKSKSISDRTESGEATDPDDSPRVNREDVSPIVEESDAIDPGPIPAGRPKLAPPDPGVGWTNSKTTATRPQDQDVEGGVTTSDASPRRRRPSDDPDTSEGEEGVNPLPPAIDPEAGVPDPARTPSTRDPRPRKTSAKVDPKSFEKEAGDMALAPLASLGGRANRPNSNAEESDRSRSLSSLLPDGDPVPSRSSEVAASAALSKESTAQGGPPDLPPVGVTAAVIAAAEPPSPTTSPHGPASQHQDDARSKPASQPVFASQVAATKPVEKPESPADYNPFAIIAPDGLPPDRVVDNPPIGRPGSAEDRSGSVASASTLDESPRRKWGELASTERPSVAVEPTKATTSGSFLRRKRTPTEGRDPSIALCSYDTRLRKINDFRLPDLEGKPVRFQDFDADYVLIDFWGTWCGPCLDSIPHLVALQKKYGPDKLKVVGIACEEVPPEQRKAKVDEVSRKLGINYPILLSTMDGKPCPVQAALQIQAMPTMILVDRRGQVLWRNSGATPEGESRLDRVLALSLSRGNTTVRR